MKRKRLLIPLALLLAISLVVTGCPSPAPPEPEVITVRVLRPWSWDMVGNVSYRHRIELGNQMGAGRVVFKDMGGSEVYPTMEQFKAVKAGAVDMLDAPVPYHSADFPEGDILFFTAGATGPEMRRIGLIDALDRIAREEHGVSGIGASSHWILQLFLVDPIDSLDDLKGLKLRGLSSYNPILHALGVSTVTLPPGEVYTALETGVIDGLAFGTIALVDFGAAEVVNYEVHPPFWPTNDHLTYVNAAWWDALPKWATDLIMEVELAVEAAAYDKFTEAEISEANRRSAMGIKTIVLSDEDWFEVQRLNWEYGTARMRKLSPKYAEELINIVEQFYPPKEVYWAPYPLP